MKNFLTIALLYATVMMDTMATPVLRASPPEEALLPPPPLVPIAPEPSGNSTADPASLTELPHPDLELPHASNASVVPSESIPSAVVAPNETSISHPPEVIISPITPMTTTTKAPEALATTTAAPEVPLSPAHLPVVSTKPAVPVVNEHHNHNKPVVNKEPGSIVKDLAEAVVAIKLAENLG